MYYLSFFMFSLIAIFLGFIGWFLNVTSFSLKAIEILLPAIGAAIFSIFLFIKFLIKNRNRNKKDKFVFVDALEILLPAFGVIIFTGFLVVKSIVTIKENKSTVVGYVNSIFSNTGDIISYPALSDSLNPSITEHTFYMTYGFMGIYLSNYLSNYQPQDILDTVEYEFLDKMLNGWVIPESVISTKSISSAEIQKMLVGNKLFDVTLEDVRSVNKKLGFEQKIGTFKDEFLYSDKKMKFIKVPFATASSYSRNADRRVLSFENGSVKFSFTIFDGGTSNFRPEYNAFHQYLARFANGGIPRHSDYMKMRKVFIIFDYEFKKYASLQDNYEEYVLLMNTIEENLKKQFFWDSLREVLEREYLLGK